VVKGLRFPAKDKNPPLLPSAAEEGKDLVKIKVAA
jgi:hypothetical protein